VMGQFGSITGQHGFRKYNSNLGIGTTSPGVQLDVSSAGGTSLRVSDSTNTSSLRYTIADATGTIQAQKSGAVSTTMILQTQTSGGTTTDTIILNAGNVGIGTATPLAKLDVSDTLGGIVTRSTSPGAAAYTVIPWETQGGYSGNLVITVNASSWAGYTYDIKVGGSGQSHHHAGAFYNNNNISAAIQSIAVGGALTVTQASQVITFTLDVTSMTNPYMTLTLGSGGGYSIKPSDVTITIN